MTLRKMINGEWVEGTPAEIVEYERLVRGTSDVRNTHDVPWTEHQAGASVTPTRTSIDDDDGTPLPIRRTQRQPVDIDPKEYRPRRYYTVTIGPRESQVLDILRSLDGEQLTSGQIADLMDWDDQVSLNQKRSRVSGALNKLAKRKLVQRVNGHWLWVLTDKGVNCPVRLSNNRGMLRNVETG
jgi:hypothetical protein